MMAPFSNTQLGIARKCGEAILRKIHDYGKPYVVAISWAFGSLIGGRQSAEVESALEDIVFGIHLKRVWSNEKLSGVLVCREWGLDWYFGYIPNPHAANPIDLPNVVIDGTLAISAWDEFSMKVQTISDWIIPCLLVSHKNDVRWNLPQSFIFKEGKKYLVEVLRPRSSIGWITTAYFVGQYGDNGFVIKYVTADGIKQEEVSMERVWHVADIPQPSDVADFPDRQLEFL